MQCKCPAVIWHLLEENRSGVSGLFRQANMLSICGLSPSSMLPPILMRGLVFLTESTKSWRFIPKAKWFHCYISEAIRISHIYVVIVASSNVIEQFDQLHQSSVYDKTPAQWRPWYYRRNTDVWPLNYRNGKLSYRIAISSTHKPNVAYPTVPYNAWYPWRCAKMLI